MSKPHSEKPSGECMPTVLQEQQGSNMAGWRELGGAGRGGAGVCAGNQRRDQRSNGSLGPASPVIVRIVAFTLHEMGSC